MSPHGAVHSAIAESRALNEMRRHGEAIALDPTNEWAHRIKSAALLALGRDQEGLAAAKEAVWLAPDNYFAHHTLLLCQTRLRDVPGARASVARLLKLGPNQMLSHQGAGELAMLEKRWQEAEVAFRRALAIEPNDPETLALLGTVLAHTSELSKASPCSNRPSRSIRVLVSFGSRCKRRRYVVSMFLSTPVLALSFGMDNQSLAFKALALPWFFGSIYVIGRLWATVVEPFLRSKGSPDEGIRFPQTLDVGTATDVVQLGGLAPG